MNLSFEKTPQRMSSLFLGIAFTLGFFPSAPAFTVQSSHPRLLLTPSDVAFIRNNSVQDGNMESLSLSSWSDIGTPTLKEKVDFLGSKRLHLKGSYSVGIQQSLPFIPHVEYQYSISIYGVSGQFGAQLYQQGNPSGELIKTTSTGGWQTFTGTFTPSSGPLLFKIYGLNGANEFYVDNVTFRPSGERVVDANMTYSDCTYWSSMAIPPLVREKTLLGSDKVLHVVGSNGSGVQQFLNFKKNNEYTYSLSLFLKSGKCRAQFYQGSKVVPILDLTAPTAGWQTINIPSTKSFFPEDDFLLVRIYANDPSGNSEFYVKNVSCKPTLERVLDGDMSDADCSYWSSTGTPQVKEKTVLNGTRQLHFIGNSTSGAYQELQFKPGVEYAFSMEIALVSGSARAHLYQNSKVVSYNATTPNSGYQVFQGTFTPTTDPLRIRFYPTTSTTNSEFYVRRISFKPVNGIDDRPALDLGPFYDYASIKENNGSPNPTPTNLANDVNMTGTVRTIAFAAMITLEPRFINLAIQYGDAIASISPSAGDDTAQRARLMSLAYIYDWLNDQLSSNEKTKLQLAMVAQFNYLESQYHFFSAPVYTGGHSRYANVVALGSLLAMNGEYPSGFNGQAWLNQIHDNWTNGYNPFQSWVASKGGYHMGWDYSSGYTDIEPYLFWKSATGESWCESWRRELASFYYYGIRGDDTFSPSGDSWAMYMDYDKLPICLGSAALGDWYAVNFMNRYNLAMDGYNYFWRILLMNENAYNCVPPRPLESLPKAKCFGPSGFVVAKDQWDLPNSTHLTFKSTSFYSLNHHHKDQNSIVLHYKGPLLLDSGDYDSYASNHWWNYYTRTVAHNTMIVYDPSEQFIGATVPRSNDGGQKFVEDNALPVGNEPYTLAQAQNPKYAFDGITAFTSTATSCSMKGDASKAYNSSKVLNYTREIAMTYVSPLNNNKPLINIKDHVVLAANKQTLIPKILFHCKNPPIINTTAKTVQIENDNGGGVEIDVVSPTNVTFNVVGGTGNEFSVNGVNFAPDVTAANPLKPTETGVWRIEISRSTPGNSDFEFNLKVYDR